MRGWVQVEPPEGASTDDEYYFAPSLFRAHNARERLAMLAGLPATEQHDSALVVQLQGASLSHGVSVGAPLPHGAPIPTAEFSSLGLSSLRAGAAPTGRALSDRTRTERREREEARTACICSAPPCICWEESADHLADAADDGPAAVPAEYAHVHLEPVAAHRLPVRGVAAGIVAAHRGRRPLGARAARALAVSEHYERLAV